MAEYAKLPQKRAQQACRLPEKDTRGKDKDSPKGTTIKIIQLFEEDPAFSSISGGVDSGKGM